MKRFNRNGGIGCKADVRKSLATQGFAIARGDDFVIAPELADAKMALADSFNELPLDPYAKAQNRRRRMSRYILHPWDGYLSLRPHTPYCQAFGHNKEARGVPRNFEPFTPGQQTNPCLLALIRYGFSQLPLSDAERSLPYDCGCHAVRLEAKPGQPGSASPPHMHRDGEPHTWVFLFGREHVNGGESIVYADDKTQIAEVTLKSSLDCLCVVDAMVWHHVREVTVIDHSPVGYRDTLLLDYTPCQPIVGQPQQ
jgi:hypothetical protein